MKKPCKTCPWRKGSPKLTVTKSGDPARFVGQAHGPFWLPCHSSSGYDENTRNVEHKQCVGAAMFRDLVGVAERLPAQLAKQKGDPNIVFGSPAEFLAHHAQIPAWVAESFLQEHPPSSLLVSELALQGVAPLKKKA